MSYDLRRLRLQGLTQRLPRCNTYQLTSDGIRVAVFYGKLQNRPAPTPRRQEATRPNRRHPQSEWIDLRFPGEPIYGVTHQCACPDEQHRLGGSAQS